MDPIISNLATYAGEYRMSLIQNLHNTLNLEAEGISVVSDVKYKLNLHRMVVGAGVKPYTGTFKAKEDIDFEPRVLEVEKAQRDISIHPSKYLPTFMAKLRGRGEDANNLNVPFEEHVWNEVLKGISQEINLETVFHGAGKSGFTAFNPASTYSAGDLVTFTQDSELRYFRCIAATTAGQSPDTHPAKWTWAGARALVKGLGKIIADEITAGNLTATTTGAISNSNAYANLLKVFRALPEVVKNGSHGEVLIYHSHSINEMYLDNLESDITKNFRDLDYATHLPKTNKVARLKPVSWLNGSNRIIAALSGNLIAGTDELGDMNTIRTIPQMYHLDAGITFMLGFQIQDLAAIAVNDQS